MSKILAFYPISPTSYGASFFNLIDTAKFKLLEGSINSEAASPTYSSNGFFFNGKSQYLRTGIVPSIDMNVYSSTVMIRGRSNDIGATELGAYISGSQNLYYQIYNATGKFSAYSDGSDRLDAINSTGTGNFFFNVVSNNSRTERRNTTQIGTKTATIQGAIPNIELYLGARNDNGSSFLWSLREVSTACITKVALTNSECDILSGIIDTYNNTVKPGGR